MWMAMSALAACYVRLEKILVVGKGKFCKDV